MYILKNKRTTQRSIAKCLRSLVLLLSLTLSAPLSVGCGEDESGSSAESSMCGADVKGTVFGLSEGSATLNGTITLPPDTPVGLSINLMLVEGNSSARRGVVPDFNFRSTSQLRCLDNLKTQGESFTYEILNLESGTYRLHLKLIEGEGDMSQDVYDQTSETTIDIEDGALVTHNEIFNPPN